MLPSVKCLTLVFALSLLIVPARAEPVDLDWLQNILKKKDEKREQAQELIATVSGKNQERKTCGGAPAVDAEAVEGKYPTLLVFVSFSMPVEALKLLGEQVQKAGGTLVFRGLVKDSFPLTAQKMRELGVEAMIDPTLFEAFHVQSVPTFVMLSKPIETMEELPAYDQITGHVSLRYALDMFHKGAK